MLYSDDNVKDLHFCYLSYKDLNAGYREVNKICHTRCVTRWPFAHVVKKVVGWRMHRWTANIN